MKNTLKRFAAFAFAASAFALPAAVVEVTTWEGMKTNLEAGASVKLMSDVSQGSSKGVGLGSVTSTLDLNGHTVWAGTSNLGNDGYRPFTCKYNKSARLTVTDTSAGQTGAIDGRGKTRTYPGGCFFVGYQHSSVTLTGGAIRNFVSSDLGCVADISNLGSFTMSGGTITNCSTTSNQGLICRVTSQSAGPVRVDGGVWVGNVAEYYLSDVHNSGDVTVRGAVSDSPKIGVRKASGKSCVQVGSLWVVGQDIAFDAENKLTGGVYTFDPGKVEYAKVGLVVSDRHLVLEQATSPKTWKIVPLAARNVDTGIDYLGVQAAFDEAELGETVMLLNDWTENVTVAAAKAIRFDLADCVLKGAGGAPVITVASDANLIIVDRGEAGAGAITTGGVSFGGNGAGISSAGHLTLLGGQITNCVATGVGAGVYVSGGSITVGGEARVLGNFSGGAASDVYLPDGQTIAVSGDVPLLPRAKIGVTTQTSPTAARAGWVPVTDASGARASEHFWANRGYAVLCDPEDANKVKFAKFGAKLMSYDGAARPTSGTFSYDVKVGSSYVTQVGTYNGILLVEGGVSNFYYETVQMAIAAAKAGAVNTGYYSPENPNGCFLEGRPYDYAANDSLSPVLGHFTDTVLLCADAGLINNRGSGDSPTANYGVRKGIVIDMNGYSATGLAAGEIAEGQVLVYCNGTAQASAYDKDIFDDEGGTGYRSGEIVFANMNLRGQIWPANHSFVFLNGTYDMKLGHTEASPENPKNLQLRGGYYMQDPTIYKIDFTDCHVELQSKHPEFAPYFCRVVKGATQMHITFHANRTDATRDGAAFTSTNAVIAYGSTVGIPQLASEGLAAVGWATSPGATEPQYTDAQVATLSAEHESEHTLYAVWKAVVRIPVFVALDGCSAVPADGRTYEFKLEPHSITTAMPATNLVALTCPVATGDVAKVGFATNDVTNPWTMNLPTGTYSYKITQTTVVRPGEKLDTGYWLVSADVSMDLQPHVKISNNIYVGEIDELGDDAFKTYKYSGEASFSSAEKALIFGSDTQTVISGNGFNRAVVKSQFAIDFTNSFSIAGKVTVGAAADGSVLGFVPKGGAPDIETAEGSSLGIYRSSCDLPQQGNGIFLEFDTLNGDSRWADNTFSGAHFAITKTDAAGRPTYTGLGKDFGSAYSLPSSEMSYTIDFDATTKELRFSIVNGSTTYGPWVYNDPVAQFGSTSAYMLLSGAMRYGPNNQFGTGNVGSPAPKTKMTLDTFVYFHQMAPGTVDNTFVNRQEALVRYNAWGGAFPDGEETQESFAEDAKTDFPPDPARKGYDFAGWYRGWTNNAAPATEGLLDPIADCTCYAKWISSAMPEGQGTNTLGYVTIGEGAVLTGAVRKIEGTDLVIPEFTSNGSDDGVPYVIIAKDSFARENYDKKRERELLKAGVEEEWSITNDLTSVTVSTYVTNIQTHAFSGCAQLTNVVFSRTRDYKTGEKSVLHVRDWAFQDSGVRSVTFPADSKIVLDYGAFADAECLRDITFLGDVELKARYPFVGSGTRIFDENGNRTNVTLHLSAKLAADPAFVLSLTNGLNNVRIKLSQQIEGELTITEGPTFGVDSIGFKFRVATDSPWFKVTEETVYLFWSTTPDPGTFIGNTPEKPYSLVQEESGEWTALFRKPAAAGSTEAYFQLRIGDAP